MISTKFLFLCLLFAIGLPCIACFNITCRCQHEQKNDLVALPVTVPNDMLRDLTTLERNLEGACNLACAEHKRKTHNNNNNNNGDNNNGKPGHVKIGKISVYRSKRAAPSKVKKAGNYLKKKVEESHLCQTSLGLFNSHTYPIRNWLC